MYDHNPQTQYGPPPGYPATWGEPLAPPPPPPVKKRTGLIVAFSVAGAVALTVCGIGIIATSDTEQPPAAAVASGSPDNARQPAPQPAPAPEWTEVATTTGSGDGHGDTFQLDGGNVRLAYEVTSTFDGLELFAAYLMPAGHTLEDDGGIPLLADQAGSGEVELDMHSMMGDLDAGEYYVAVIAANCSWTVTVEELR